MFSFVVLFVHVFGLYNAKGTFTGKKRGVSIRAVDQ